MNSLQKHLKIFVINLPEDQQKKNRIKKLLSKFKFNYEFFKAVNGKDKKINSFLGYSDKKRRLFFGRSLLPKELGIFESHKLIYQKIIKNKINHALIFEDDVCFDKNFKYFLFKILDLDYQWDLIRFISGKKLDNAISRKVIDLSKEHYLKRFPKLYGGAHAYLISLEGAKKLLELTNNFYYPIDLVMGQTWKNNLNSLICNPGLVWQEKELNIDPPESIRFKKQEKKLLSLYIWTRGWFKIYETASKWINYLSWKRRDNLAYKKLDNV